MLQPKRVIYRKQQRGRTKGLAQRGNSVAFGDFGLMALEATWVTSRQIEAARRAITHHVKRGGKVWIRIFPDKPVTAKPAETRMGSGTRRRSLCRGHQAGTDHVRAGRRAAGYRQRGAQPGRTEDAD